MKKRFSEMYHLSCEAVEESIRKKLGRPLTEAEWYTLWNTGSLLFLEAFERTLISAQSAEEVGTLLAQQEQASRAALEQAVQTLSERIAELLQRALSHEEKRKLHALRTVEEAMRIDEELIEEPLDQRETAFRRVVDREK